MTMKFSQLKTHWTPDDAHAILSLLDELRDALWNTYGAEIIELQHKQQHKLMKNTDSDSKQLNWLDDSIEDERIPF